MKASKRLHVHIENDKQKDEGADAVGMFGRSLPGEWSCLKSDPPYRKMTLCYRAPPTLYSVVMMGRSIKSSTLVLTK